MEQKAETRDSYNYGRITDKNKTKWKGLQKRCLVPLIRLRMRDLSHEEVDIPSYLMELFNHFCEQKSSVNVSCFRMEMEFMDETLRRILFKRVDDGEYTVDIDTLNVILPNLREFMGEDGRVGMMSPRGLSVKEITF